MRKTLFASAVLVALPVVALAQGAAAKREAVEITAKIEAIDKSARLVSLKDSDGDTETIYCGPEVKRFDELKVGDTVAFRYYQSLAHEIRKPGQRSSLPAPTGASVTRGTGPRPGGTITLQTTAAVTIKAIDTKVPSVTVLTEDGRTVSFKVGDKQNLQDVQVGDKVEVTYTEALMVSVK